MREVFQVLDKIIDSDMPVIIQGESGTGKELVARAIHYNGPFSHGKFVSENCAALPSQLLESILFGHEKGAFTGAHQNRKGLFEVASGGTLFLDEIGEMSPAMQVKILRAIQEGEIRPLGANYSIHVKVRIISASNQNLQDLVHNGKFRKDLYYRLRGIDIHLPPLRERREDIPLLVKHFLKEFSEGKMKISRAAARLLYHYNWPGNIQEMRNSLERATLICGQGEIQAEDLPEEIRGHQKPSLPKGTLPFLEAKKQFERNYLTDLLQVHSGNITRAATATGLYRQYLHRLLKKHKLQ
jgi:DNA-binding NtrC family response regulator